MYSRTLANRAAFSDVVTDWAATTGESPIGFSVVGDVDPSPRAVSNSLLIVPIIRAKCLSLNGVILVFRNRR